MVKRIALMLSLVGAVAVMPAQPPASAQSEEAGEQYVFVQQASEAQVEDDGLVLSGLGPATVYFSERPERDVGQLTYAEFLDAWARGADSFASDPPNASLAFRSEGKQQVVVLELMEPTFSHGNLRYTTRLLEGELPERFGPATLFIDGGGLMQLVAYGAQD